MFKGHAELKLAADDKFLEAPDPVFSGSQHATLDTSRQLLSSTERQMQAPGSGIPTNEPNEEPGASRSARQETNEPEHVRAARGKTIPASSPVSKG